MAEEGRNLSLELFTQFRDAVLRHSISVTTSTPTWEPNTTQVVITTLQPVLVTADRLYGVLFHNYGQKMAAKFVVQEVQAQ
ncbi:hypothetical protein GALMADRAFT_138522 [Galerina marginata CBS 339.88]|uniref:Uncharacterized protein n=1 Tax=Galerina marginata (strain CBS 339.88) TaxID=685588 RepID=A0A067T2Q3_GALM3|nr:hypothetical protein GALMADRAFT_138522 [Galerina marginata CBS 339.88]